MKHQHNTPQNTLQINWSYHPMETLFPRCWRIGNSPPPDKPCFYAQIIARLKINIKQLLIKKGGPPLLNQRGRTRTNVFVLICIFVHLVCNITKGWLFVIAIYCSEAELPRLFCIFHSAFCILLLHFAILKCYTVQVI